MDTNREASGNGSDDARIPLEELVATTDELYAAIIDSASVGVAHIAIDGLIVRVNPSLCEMTGFTPTDLRSMRVDDLITPRSEAERCTLADFVSGAKDEVFLDALCSCRNGGNLPASVQGALVHGVAGVPAYGVMIIDPRQDPES